ncbi:hypothetical protein Krac_4671 [Ktedonobacter racemifer DSM 44963]|uniref:Uncharacterized protein n=1 Tax=Ktedonobacter racemifer DSM 44963 TaxID=485913 RepID=D6TTC6_KTERA|nr:hypothetical protein Krac_4671 [Ktedonobacter racemifer DSM 44963]
MEVGAFLFFHYPNTSYVLKYLFKTSRHYVARRVGLVWSGNAFGISTPHQPYPK